MAFFWFLIAVILFFVLISRKKGKDSDEYAQGYWDGYRALGDKVQELIRRRTLNAETVQKLIDEANVTTDNSVADGMLLEDDFVSDLDESAQTTTATVATEPTEQSFVVTELTPEEKAKQSLRNLNTVLYMASFLLVAAGALFVGAAMPDTVKLVGVWAIILAFYGVGFGLYLTVERLRPAALAFLGTGMALIPFAGFALHEYAHFSVAAAWVVTSLIGLVAYLLVALRLQSQLVSYLTLAFVFSLVGSTAATADAGLVLQLCLFIIASLLASVIAAIKSQWMPAVFRQPIEHTGQVVTPLVLLASLVLSSELSFAEHELVVAVALLHYVVAWLQSRTIFHEAAIRILFSVFALIVALDVSQGSGVAFGMTLLIVATAQQAYSLFRVVHAGHEYAERHWMTWLFFVQAGAFLLWADSSQAALYNVIGVGLIGITSLAAALRLRSAKVGLIGLVASLLLPFLMARDLFVPTLPWWSLTAVYLGLAILALYGCARMTHRSLDLRQFMTSAYLLYAAAALLTAWTDGSALVLTLTYIALAAFVVAISHVTHKAWAVLVTAVLIFAGIVHWSTLVALPAGWQHFFIATVTAAVLWSLSGVYGYLADMRRAIYAFVSAQVAFVTIALGAIWGSAIVNQWTVGALLGVSALVLAFRATLARQSRTLRIVSSLSYILYAMIGVLLAQGLASGWILAALLFGVVLFVAASYVERRPLLQLVAVPLLVAAVAQFGIIVHVLDDWMVLFVFGGSAGLLYVATMLHARFKQVERQLVTIGSAQVVLLLTAFGAYSFNLDVIRVTALLLLAATIASVVARWWYREQSLALTHVFVMSYPLYFATALCIASCLGFGWTATALIIGAILFWVVSYIERAPWIIIISNVLLVFTSFYFWSWLALDAKWLTLAVVWSIAAIYAVGYGIFAYLGDRWREKVMFWSSLIVLAVGIVLQFFVAGLVVPVAATLLALALLLAIDGYRYKDWYLVEIGLYVATFGLQRLVWSVEPTINTLAYAHWWALTLAAVALVRKRNRQTRVILAMGLISLSSGLYAIGYGGYYQLLFLVEHIALLVIGALRAKNWAIWWGIVATALAILYFLRSYTFLWLGFLGLLLIGIVVWRLMRTEQKA